MTWIMPSASVILIIVGYVLISLVIGFMFAVSEERYGARNNISPQHGFTIAAALFWPLFLLAGGLKYFAEFFLSLAKRMANIEHLPEVRDRKIKEAEKELDL